MTIQNIPLTAFEITRRQVDKDPAKFIADWGSMTPSDSEDYYLLGRAYFLIKDYPKAKEALLESKKRLNEAGETNRKILELDIPALLSIIDNPKTAESPEAANKIQKRN